MPLSPQIYSGNFAALPQIYSGNFAALPPQIQVQTGRYFRRLTAGPTASLADFL